MTQKRMAPGKSNPPFNLRDRTFMVTVRVINGSAYYPMTRASAFTNGCWPARKRAKAGIGLE
jgi:hypothetical protein